MSDAAGDGGGEWQVAGASSARASSASSPRVVAVSPKRSDEKQSWYEGIHVPPACDRNAEAIQNLEHDLLHDVRPSIDRLKADSAHRVSALEEALASQQAEAENANVMYEQRLAQLELKVAESQAALIRLNCLPTNTEEIQREEREHAASGAGAKHARRRDPHSAAAAAGRLRLLCRCLLAWSALLLGAALLRPPTGQWASGEFKRADAAHPESGERGKADWAGFALGAAVATMASWPVFLSDKQLNSPLCALAAAASAFLSWQPALAALLYSLQLLRQHGAAGLSACFPSYDGASFGDDLCAGSEKGLRSLNGFYAACVLLAVAGHCLYTLRSGGGKPHKE